MIGATLSAHHQVGPLATPPIEAEPWVRHALDQVAASAVAGELAGVCAHLAPERIPCDLLARWAEVSQATEDEVHDAVELLLDRALLAGAANGTVRMHRVVQDVVRGAADLAGRERAAIGAVRLLGAALPVRPWEQEHWPILPALLAHALSAAEHAERYGVALGQAARVLARAGQYHEARSEPATAAQLLERALALKEACYGPEHAQVALTLGNLGSVRQQLGELDAACATQQRSLAILQQVYGREHRDVAIALGNLASVQQELGDLDAACTTQLRALAIKEVVHGPRHVEVTIALEKLESMQQAIAASEAARARPPRASRARGVAVERVRVATVV